MNYDLRTGWRTKVLQQFSSLQAKQSEKSQMYRQLGTDTNRLIPKDLALSLCLGRANIFFFGNPQFLQPHVTVGTIFGRRATPFKPARCRRLHSYQILPRFVSLCL